MIEMELVDDRGVSDDVYTLFHRIRRRVQGCYNYDIDLDKYIDKNDLYDLLKVLDCCLDHKDSKYIVRKK